MAVIKYKDSEGLWVPVPTPVKVVESPTAGKPVEYVEIVGTNAMGAFPDLSPYISDINQIACLIWDEADCSNQFATSTTNIYVPTYSNQLRRKICIFRSTKNLSGTSNSIYQVTEDTAFTIGGTPEALKKYNASNTEFDMKYVGILNLYYYPEVS